MLQMDTGLDAYCNTHPGAHNQERDWEMSSDRV